MHPNQLIDQELAPQAIPRSQATNQASSISQMDDDALLDNLSDNFLYTMHQSRQTGQGTPPIFSPSKIRETTPMDTGDTGVKSTTGDKLLTLRKDFKKTPVSLIKAKAHLDFASACSDKGQTPKGLRVNVQCSALLADLTDKFANTTHMAQGGLRTTPQNPLWGSGGTTGGEAKPPHQTTTMQALQQHTTPEEARAHREMMEKTSQNLHKPFRPQLMPPQLSSLGLPLRHSVVT